MDKLELAVNFGAVLNAVDTDEFLLRVGPVKNAIIADA